MPDCQGLTRTEVAKPLGISTSSVRRMEFDRLHPVADEHGVWRFDPAEVAAVTTVGRRRRGARKTRSARGREGRMAAKVFALFARRWTLPQIVIETCERPSRIRALYHEWSTSLESGEWARERR